MAGSHEVIGSTPIYSTNKGCRILSQPLFLNLFCWFTTKCTLCLSCRFLTQNLLINSNNFVLSAKLFIYAPDKTSRFVYTSRDLVVVLRRLQVRGSPTRCEVDVFSKIVIVNAVAIFYLSLVFPSTYLFINKMMLYYLRYKKNLLLLHPF